MDIQEATFLFAAAFLAGTINSVAGGGSLVSFPALLAAGYPAKAANVTNSVALWPGYVSGSFAYRQEIGAQRSRAVALVAPSVLGAIAGSVILLSTPESAFEAIVPFLILFACALMALQDRLANVVSRRGVPETGVPWSVIAAVFVLAIYGAYFGAGLGILTLAVLGIFLPDDIQRSNAMKSYLSLVINVGAVVYFAAFGPVRWLPAAVMAAGAMAGGYLGVGVARRLGKRWLRITVITYGVAVALILLVR